MPSALAEAALEAGVDIEPKTAPRPKPNGQSGIFASANSVPVVAVLGWLGLLDGEQPICPGCRESDPGVAIVGNGLKCQHDRCAKKGVPGKPGFRTCVDLVMEGKGIDALEASRLLCERFEIEVPGRKKSNGAAHDRSHDYLDDIMDPTIGAEVTDAPAASRASKPLLEVVYSDVLFAPLEEPSYVVDEIVRRASLTEIVSYGGSGKTWLAVNMMIALGAGVPWLGRFDTKAGKVVGLDYENGSYEMRRRLKANARALGFDAVPGIGLVSMPQLYMYDPKFEGAMLALTEGCDLGIIDTLKAGNPGVDENDSNMRSGLDTLRRVAEKTNTGFVVLVHAKKTSGSVTTVDPREAGRGSSAIYDAADTVLHVMYAEGKPLRIMQTKARLGRPVKQFQVEILDGENGAVQVVASDIPRDDTTAADRFEASCMRVLEAVRANPGHARPVYRETLGMRNQVVTAALERLTKDGAIRNVGTKKDPRWFPTGGSGSDE